MEEVVLKLLLLFLVIYVQNEITPTHAAQTTQKVFHYSIPDKRLLKKSLGFIEDTYMNFTELTNKYGYPTEKHNIITEDGYILGVFRILSKCEGKPRGFPVVMMHGIYDTSDLWILSGPRTGLGYILAKKCYDVWAANHRGNFYSRRHVTLNPNMDAEFWNYTFEEHGYYDIPAIVDYVINTTQQSRVNYIGHSQGTTDFFVMGSLRPEYNNKIQLSFHLAPVAWMAHMRSLIPKLAAQFAEPFGQLFNDLGLRELFGKHQITHVLLEYLCQFSPEDICGTAFSITTGYKRGNISPRNLAVAFGHLLAGISTKDLIHLGQLISSRRFQRYDYGMNENFKKYGSAIPPEYDVSKITSSVVLISAQNDWLSSLEDVETLSSKLPNLVQNYIVPDPTWSHNDQVYGKNAPILVFPKILELLNKFNY